MIRLVLAAAIVAVILVGCGSSDGDIPKDQSPQHPLGAGPGRIHGMADANRIAEQEKAKSQPR